MKIGYARVSTEDQSLSLQLDALKKAGCERIFKKKVSGVSRTKPERQKLREQLRKGDTVVVWKLDRLARSTRELLEIIESIGAAGAKFQSVSESWADTTSAGGKMVMTVFAGIAEFERELIRERTSAGRTAAMTRGVKFGRPQKLTVDQKRLVIRLVDEGQSISQVAKTFGVHIATVYRVLENTDELLAQSGSHSAR